MGTEPYLKAWKDMGHVELPRRAIKRSIIKSNPRGLKSHKNIVSGGFLITSKVLSLQPTVRIKVN